MCVKVFVAHGNLLSLTTDASGKEKVSEMDLQENEPNANTDVWSPHGFMGSCCCGGGSHECNHRRGLEYLSELRLKINKGENKNRMPRSTYTPFPTLFFCGCAHKLKQTISHAHTHTHHPSPTPPLHTHHTLNHIIHFQLNNELPFSCVFSALCHEQRSHHRIISYNSSE